jgi:DNA-binding transcriptional MerR regulator
MAATSEDVIDACGITYRQLDYWVRKGWLQPRDRRQHTAGVPRDFDDEELAVAARMARLIDRGFTPRAAARIARVTPGYVHLGQGIHLHLHDDHTRRE